MLSLDVERRVAESFFYRMRLALARALFVKVRLARLVSNSLKVLPILATSSTIG